tara:strand:+ start:178 stop:543 length:366 start_codon:yes stop_codon:yes gene_type:complete
MDTETIGRKAWNRTNIIVMMLVTAIAQSIDEATLAHAIVLREADNTETPLETEAVNVLKKVLRDCDMDWVLKPSESLLSAEEWLTQYRANQKDMLEEYMEADEARKASIAYDLAEMFGDII